MSTRGKIEKFFSAEGPLSEAIPHYCPREGQLRMATAISGLLSKQGGQLAVEAGTGVGKSLAYLVPSLLQDPKPKRPLIVSTGTISLQEQLVHRDLPALAECMPRAFKAVLAIGRNNYVCQHRLKDLLSKGTALFEDEESRALKQLEELMERKSIITASDLTLPIPPETWTQIQSEAPMCGQARCKGEPCSFLLARSEMNTADIVVVNHSLLFVHLALQSRSNVRLLPNFGCVVLDEAHRCHGIATDHFGMMISNGRLRFLLDQIYSNKGKGFLGRIKGSSDLLKRLITELRTQNEFFFNEMLEVMQTQANKNGRLVKPPKIHNRLAKPLEDLAMTLANWSKSLDDENQALEANYYSRRCQEFRYELNSFLEQKTKDAAYWIEERKQQNGKTRNVQCRLAYLDIAPLMNQLLFEEVPKVILTSATLSTEGKFHFLRAQLGIPDDAKEMIVESPFDFASQACIYSLRRAPQPNALVFQDFLPQQVRKCIGFTGGGVFVLTTSFSIINLLYRDLEFFAEDKGYQLEAQGITGSRKAILERFRETDRGILLGNFSFWEGVDVPGKSLRNVIITRLPFEPPNHPLLEARYEAVEASGKSSFYELSLPSAVMRLKQGFGRLIRRIDDAGIVCVLDPRLHLKSYGRSFLNSLPSCPVYIDENPDSSFLKKLREIE